MAPACPASVTARQAGRVNDAIRSISRCISVYRVVRTMARTTSSLPRASARNIGLGSIVHNPVVAWTVVLMDPANRVAASQYNYLLSLLFLLFVIKLTRNVKDI